MAYVLGFIAADGNISVHGRAHMMQLACDDEDVIEKIKNVMDAEIPTLKRPRINGKTSYQFRVSDKTLFNDLVKLDITLRKSLTLKPSKVPKKYLHDYLRGFFDGDGSVSSTKKNKLISEWYTGSRKMANFLYLQLKRICPEFKGKVLKLPKRNNFYYSLSFGMRDSKLIFKFLYKNASIYMNRKYRKFFEGIYA